MRAEPPSQTGPGADTVAVVGMGLAVPGATSPEQFWELLTQGADLLVDPPADRWRADDFVDADRSAPDKTYQQAGGFVTGLGAGRDDYAQIWLRHCVDQALAEVRQAAGDRYSLCLGYTADGSLHQEEALVVEGVLARAQGLEPQDAEMLRSALRRRFARVGAPGR